MSNRRRNIDGKFLKNEEGNILEKVNDCVKGVAYTLEFIWNLGKLLMYIGIIVAISKYLNVPGFLREVIESSICSSNKTNGSVEKDKGSGYF